MVGFVAAIWWVGAAVAQSQGVALEGTVIDVSPDDAYYGARNNYIGLHCTASDAKDNGGGFYGGQFRCSDGSGPYFYKVKLKTGGAPAAGKSPTPTPVPAPAPAPAPSVTRTWKLVEIDASDAFYGSRDSYVGRMCAPVAPSDKGGGWFGGSFDCDGSFEPYFLKARFEQGGSASVKAPAPAPVAAPVPAPVAAPAPAPARVEAPRPTPKPAPSDVARAPKQDHSRGRPFDQSEGATLKRGSKLYLVDVHEGDKMVGSAKSSLGDECRATTTLVSRGGGWWTGEVVCGAQTLWLQRGAFAPK